MDLPVRKSNRLSNYSYSQSGVYFITICSVNKLPIFCRIHPEKESHPPVVELSNYGNIVEKQILSIPNFYSDICVDKYVIMPNHIHLLITLHQKTKQAAVPANDRIPVLISSFKRFTNKSAGINLWHRSYHDHVIRDEADYLTRWKYIDDNPSRWMMDRFYIPEL